MLRTTEKHIRDSLEFHRRCGRLSRRALSSAFGWSPNTVQRMETGQAVITLPQLIKLADFFNETLAEFVDTKWSKALEKRNAQQTE